MVAENAAIIPERSRKIDLYPAGVHAAHRICAVFCNHRLLLQPPDTGCYFLAAAADSSDISCSIRPDSASRA
jgi:hypothetical protein